MQPLTHLERRIIRHQLRHYAIPAGVSVFHYLRGILSNRLNKS